MSKREDILNRLLDILEGVSGIAAAKRNLDQFPQSIRPMVILLDGDEEFPGEYRDHKFLKGRAPLLVEMAPLIELSVGGTPENVGSNANILLARIQTAVLMDTELETIIGPNGAVYYVASDTRISHSMAMDCDLQIRFAIRYKFNPASP